MPLDAREVQARRRRRKFRRLRGVAEGVGCVLFGIALALSLPVTLPLLGLSEWRRDRRTRRIVEHWPCGWCVAPLGSAALAQADHVKTAYFDAQIHDDDVLYAQPRIVHAFQACCVRCGAAHRLDEQTGSFAILEAGPFEERYGAFVGTPAVRMAWPWLLPDAPMHTLSVLRDESDGPDTSDSSTILVPAMLDVAAIAEALLRLPWLGVGAADPDWHAVARPVGLDFGLAAGEPYVRRHGPAARAETVAVVRVRSRCQAYHQPRNVP